MYRNRLLTLFKSITQGSVDVHINITGACADTEMNLNSYSITASVDHTSIPIKYRQENNNSCGFYSLASVLDHIQDADLGLAIKQSYNEKEQLKNNMSQVRQCQEIVQKKNKKYTFTNMKKKADHITC